MFKKCFLLALGVVFTSLAPASSLYYVDDADDTLHVFDTVALTSTLIGSTEVDSEFGDMAWDRTTCTMYFLGGRDNSNLYTLNLTTGAASLVGTYGVADMFALAVNANGELFAQSAAEISAAGDNFYKLNKTTGAATLVGGNFIYPGGLTFNTATGQMILTESGAANVFEIDEATGATTLIGGSGSINDNDIAYDSTTNEFWAMDWNGDAFRYDGSYNRSLMASGFGDVAAADFANPVPEPATLIACSLGIAAMLLRKRRQ